LRDPVYRFLNIDGEGNLTIKPIGKAHFYLRSPLEYRASWLDMEGSVPKGWRIIERNANMTINVGDKIPDVKLVKATADGPQPVQSSEYFAGRKVALFSVPGAFTPTCSARHLPGYVEKADELKAQGIDEIACTAVNDAFVLGAWNKSGGSDDISMLADGNADFAEALGLTMDGSGFGMGKRGQRFSMVVNDGVVEQLNVEAPGDFKVSSAEHMLGQL
jgi:glutaredoxin/glutathione-dependent peroxiredoxin